VERSKTVPPCIAQTPLQSGSDPGALLCASTSGTATAPNAVRMNAAARERTIRMMLFLWSG
jgi:hypothetical protein